MPPTTLPPPQFQPRVICYHQTHYNRAGEYVSILPLLTEPTGGDVIAITHLVLAAIHLNDAPGDINLNNDPPNAPKYAQLWEEVRVFQDVGVKVLGMVGGAAKGSFRRLDPRAGSGSGSQEAGSSESESESSLLSFERYYGPLRDMVRAHGLDGLDLDVEEDMSLEGIVALIDRLKADFGDDFLITLSPVATALQGLPHLSGFDYEALEALRGASSIAWYHVQFYNGWGQPPTTTYEYDALVTTRGWPPHKLVVGVLTSPQNGHPASYVSLEDLTPTLSALARAYPRFGGVVGWEYFNSLPGGLDRPWEWADAMMRTLRRKSLE